jgi:uroporphyrinogen decarboxylase
LEQLGISDIPFEILQKHYAQVAVILERINSFVADKNISMAIKNDLLLRTIAGEKVERPPIWLMRQAGRILPQYRALRSSVSGFIELVTTPDLVAEVTIQPVDELEVDAAIIFSDILVIPECMGLPYTMVEKVGPRFPETIESVNDIDRLLSGEEAAHQLDYVYEGLKLTKSALNDRVPLIGFAGAPWTLMAYMVEGGGSKTFSKAKRFLYRYPNESHQLLSKITDTTIAYLHKKIDAGADLVQVFDSWAGMLSRELYEAFCIPYLKKINDAIQERVPTIIFSKGAWFSLDQIGNIGSNVVGLDWNITPQYARTVLGAKRLVQGNLDPCVLYGHTSDIEQKAEEIINAFGGHQIFNLGHGVYPDTPLDNVRTLVNYVKGYTY